MLNKDVKITTIGTEDTTSPNSNFRPWQFIVKNNLIQVVVLPKKNILFLILKLEKYILLTKFFLKILLLPHLNLVINQMSKFSLILIIFQ